MAFPLRTRPPIPLLFGVFRPKDTIEPRCPFVLQIFSGAESKDAERRRLDISQQRGVKTSIKSTGREPSSDVLPTDKDPAVEPRAGHPRILRPLGDPGRGPPEGDRIGRPALHGAEKRQLAQEELADGHRGDAAARRLRPAFDRGSQAPDPAGSPAVVVTSPSAAAQSGRRSAGDGAGLRPPRGEELRRKPVC